MEFGLKDKLGCVRKDKMGCGWENKLGCESSSTPSANHCATEH